MPTIAWLDDLRQQWGDDLRQERKQRRLERARITTRKLFLVPLRMEVLEQRIVLAADFGDAPTPYPTLLAENGAQHTLAGPRLGPTRDSEANGAHSANANADGSDEDGVSLGTLQVGALGAKVNINVQGGAAKLDAWIDFNSDGSWGGPGEQIFASRSVAVGSNDLKFDVPSWAVRGTTFARFRLSSAGDLGPKGPAADGEVEDFAVDIARSARSSGEFESRNPISATVDEAYSVFAADVDGDGDIDVLSASYYGDEIAWHENDGSQNFTARTISSAVDGPISVFATDVDGDGDVDVLSASRNDDKIAWYENDGNRSFTTRVISTAADGARSVCAADVDGDGDIDVLSASYYDGKIAWYENNGRQTFTPRTISTTAVGAQSVFAADMDGDGDVDVLSANGNETKIAWYENDGSRNFTPQTVSSVVRANMVFAADMDRDGDMDVLSASVGVSAVSWHENDGNQNFTLRMISSTADEARSVFAADMDGDGDLDVVAANYNGNKVVWYENDGSQNFTALLISTGVKEPMSVFASDVDGDGDLDVLSASLYDDKIAWYENVVRSPFEIQTISMAADGARSVFAVDLDEDGDIDVLSASSGDDKIAWHENDGNQNFMLRTISLTADEARSVIAADVDGDGDLDVLSASRDDDKIAWYENDGSQNFTEYAISVTADGAYAVIATDVDGDGDLDVLSASRFDNKIAWYENDGNQNFAEYTISIAASGARSVLGADFDGDGDLDVVSAAYNSNEVTWYENDGSQNFTAHLITSEATFASVLAIDVNGDGDQDVICAATIGVAWYENDGSGNFTLQTISAVPELTRSVFAADVDGDGDLDVVSASFEGTDKGKISWYENDGSQNFTAQTVSTAIDGPQALFAADVDGDGDMDVLSASSRDDRIAWYENRRFEFGDAPAPYPTLLAENGAQHGAVGPMLGATRDSEAAGKHSITADADGADDDGVTFGTMRAGMLDATLTVNVQGGAARLDAWIDFNGDGHWGGPGEQIVDSRSVVIGNNTLSFDVPAWAKAGTTFARFRLSTAGGLGPGGQADDGEVEDYAITILPAAPANGVFRGQTTISATTKGANSVVAADLDGDGDQDLLSASRNDNRIGWYENDGQGAFTPHTISTAAMGAYAVSAADADGDGDLDVLSASFNDDKLAWYENDGNQNFVARTISTTADGASSVFAADIDGDGDLDVLSASQLDDKIAWYENDGNQNFAARVISTSANGAFSVFAADVDRDGDLDVLSASQFDDKIACFENDGDQNFTARVISTEADGARSVFATDLDADGDLDVLSASFGDDKLAWYENDGNQNFTARTISTTANGAWSVFAADLDGDGDQDVLSASFYDNKIAWYKNDGSQNFTAQTISTAARNARSVVAADVDGDGDLDVLSASFTDDKIAWYAQNAAPTLAKNIGVTVVEGDKAFIGSFRLLVSDRDNTPAQLVYTIINQPARGHLELSTAPGIAITSFTQAQVNANQLRYQHDGSETTSDSFRFTIGDGLVNGLLPTTFNITVTPAAGAPVLNTALSPTLTAISEDASAPVGTLVSRLLTGAVSDPDAGALRGIAVTAAANTSGTWQYSLNGGTSWIAMGTVSNSSALLLPDSARIRLIPKANFNGTVKLSYRAWDQSLGSAGSRMKVIGNRGGAKCLSFAQESASLLVTPLNDAPVLNNALNPRLAAISEDPTSNPGTLINALVGGVSDIDAGAVKGIALTFVSHTANGIWQCSLNNGSSWLALGAVSPAAAKLLKADGLTRLRFVPQADFNGTVQIEFYAWDRTRNPASGTANVSLATNRGGSTPFSQAIETATLKITPVNDLPRILLGGTIGYERDTTAIVLASGAGVTDADNLRFTKGRLRVRITDGASVANLLAIGTGFTVDSNNRVWQGTTLIGQRISNGVGTNELVVTFTSGATVPIVEKLVRSLSFKTSGGSAATRKVIFTVSDGSGGISQEATKTVNVT